MGFTITTREVQAGDRSGIAYLLGNTSDTVRAEVWPTHGFNCLRWSVKDAAGKWDNILFCAPDWETNPVPTRSGHPILFPFPNRMRGGKFTHNGKEYQLPLNEASGKHAIHGFTPRNVWRVVGISVTETDATITGEFQLSKDLPQALTLWPADARLRVTYRISETALAVEATVDAADGKILPFGLGYHPYFRAPGGDDDVKQWQMTAHAETVWLSQENLPTGEQPAIPAELDFRSKKPVGATQLDTLFGNVRPRQKAGGDLGVVCTLESSQGPYSLEVAVDPAFRELLLFTPQHRKAVALEPYTCATDAANLQEQGIDAGWRVLNPGEKFTATVEYRLENRRRDSVRS
jgi:aldose 1-epimerase